MQPAGLKKTTPGAADVVASSPAVAAHDLQYRSCACEDRLCRDVVRRPIQNLES